MEYNEKNSNEALEIIKDIELKILIEVDKICRENDIEYSLSSGTLIGAVRHQGFIPWDDDIDLMMTIDNYYKFIKIAREKLPKRYSVENEDTAKDWNIFFLKVVDNNTTFINKVTRDLDFPKSIGIDIFPCFGFPKSKLKKINKKKHIAVSLEYCQYVEKQGKPWLKTFIKRVIKNNVKMHSIIKYFFREMTKYEHENKEMVITDFVEQDIYLDYNIFRNGYQDIIFEGYKFRCIIEYDKYLRGCYGDYMKLPPIEEQVPHHDYLYFNDQMPYREYKLKYEK